MSREMGRGRTPALTEAELIATIDRLTSPEWPVADTKEVHDALDDPPTERTVRDTLAAYSDDPNSPLRGRTPGNQKGWVWWTVPHAPDD